MTKLVAFLAALLAAGCPPTPPPVEQPPTQGSICIGQDPGPVAGSCGQERTVEGWLCALCAAERGCMDTQTFTWCVGDKGCDDPACGVGKFKRKAR